MRLAPIPDARGCQYSGSRGHWLAAVAICATLGLLVAACSRRLDPAGPPGDSHATSVPPGCRGERRAPVDHAAGGRHRTSPNRGITVTAAGGRITNVVVRTRGEPVTGRLNAAGTLWHSRWALDVSQRYTVTATARGRPAARSRGPARSARSRRRRTFSTRIVEGYRQTYGVGMPIILYFSRPVINRAAVERALRSGPPSRSSAPGTGTAMQHGAGVPVFPAAQLLAAAHPGELHRPPERGRGRAGRVRAPHAHADFTIGRSLIVVASTARHS